MWLTSFTHLAELHELQAGLDGLLVLARVVVHLLAGGTSQFDESVLRHNQGNTWTASGRMERLEPAIGFEPMTYGLQNRCSTAELRRRGGVAQ